MKLYTLKKFDKLEEDFINSIQIGSFNVAYRDENGEINGLSILGYVVLVRHNRGQSKVSFKPCVILLTS
jgi:hypothetical protein